MPYLLNKTEIHELKSKKLPYDTLVWVSERKLFPLGW